MRFRLLGAVGLLLLSGCSRLTVEELDQQLRPNYEVSAPAGEGPFPVALLYHGCGGLVGADGPKEIMDRYAAAANEAGYVAVIVDSFTPRGIGASNYKKVCSGLRLRGATRASDVVASLMYAESLPFATDEGFVLAGWSHGGWTVMEAMIDDLDRTWPKGMKRPPADLYNSVSGVYLTYPYCGFPSQARKKGWARPIPASIVTAEFDTVARRNPCEKAFDRMAESGVPMAVEEFTGVTHAFDEEDQSPTSSFKYDPDATERALERFKAFLVETKNSAAG